MVAVAIWCTEYQIAFYTITVSVLMSRDIKTRIHRYHIIFQEYEVCRVWSHDDCRLALHYFNIEIYRLSIHRVVSSPLICISNDVAIPIPVWFIYSLQVGTIAIVIVCTFKHCIRSYLYQSRLGHLEIVFVNGQTSFFTCWLYLSTSLKIIILTVIKVCTVLYYFV